MVPPKMHWIEWGPVLIHEMSRNRRVTRLVSEGCDWCGAAMQPLRGGEGGVVGIAPSHGSGVRWCQRATALVTASADQLGPVLLAGG